MTRHSQNSKKKKNQHVLIPKFFFLHLFIPKTIFLREEEKNQLPVKKKKTLAKVSMKKKAAKPLSFSVSQPCSLSTWRRVVADLALVADGSEVQAVRVEGAEKKKKKKKEEEKV